MVCDCAWIAAESVVFAAASVLGVAGACAVWVSCEHLPAKRLMSLGVVWVASTGTGAVPLGSGAGVAFACRCLDEVRASGGRADSPAHVRLAVIVPETIDEWNAQRPGRGVGGGGETTQKQSIDTRKPSHMSWVFRY